MSSPERATTFIRRCFIVPVHRNVDNIVSVSISIPFSPYSYSYMLLKSQLVV